MIKKIMGAALMVASMGTQAQTFDLAANCTPRMDFLKTVQGFKASPVLFGNSDVHEGFILTIWASKEGEYIVALHHKKTGVVCPLDVGKNIQKPPATSREEQPKSNKNSL